MACTTMTAGLLLVLAGCAQQPGAPEVKVYHGGGEMPSFEALNYDVYLGRRCSGPDADGRSYSSLVWLKANRPDGSHGPLKASADNCADHALASRR